MADGRANADCYNTSDGFYQEVTIINKEVQTLYYCNQPGSHVSGIFHIDARDLISVPKTKESYVKLHITFKAGKQLDMPIHKGESTLYNCALNFNDLKEIQIITRGIKREFYLKIHGYLNWD